MPAISVNEQQADVVTAKYLMAARQGDMGRIFDLLTQVVDIDVSNANGVNALHLASKEGHLDAVNELLSRGANVDAVTYKGNTALHMATLAGHEQIVTSLILHGANVNIRSQNGFTPIYMAAQENHVEVVRFLLSHGASLTLATHDGFTPMDVAIQQGHEKVIAALSEFDSSPRRRNQLPALHAAAKRDDVATASLLLQGDNDIDAPSQSGFTPLHVACHYGNLNIVRFLINSNADVNYNKTRNLISPLHIASKWGHVEMIELLLNSYADMQCRTRDGLTPLHCAARSGHDKAVELLLRRGASVAAKTKSGLRSLHMAVQGDHSDCVQLLLDHGAPIEDTTVDYLSPLHVAAHCGNVRSAQVLLDNRCIVDSRALNGFTPLHVACKKKRRAVVELLLKYKASLNATTESGLTPLHVAAFMGDANVARQLLAGGASHAAVTSRGETPLHLAARAGETDVIRMLLQNKADIDPKSKDDLTPLHLASRIGDVDTVVLLLQNGAKPDAVTSDLYTPLHLAAREGHVVVAQALLEQGAGQKQRTKKGFTPLHLCAKYNRAEVAALLLTHGGISADIAGRNGLTPLHVATHYGHLDAAQALLSYRADPRCIAQNGYTPLHVAARRNQLDVARLLLDDRNTNPNARSKNGFTPLHLAAQEGHRDMVNLLLGHAAHVNCAALNGLRPLHLAAQEDHLPVVEIIVVDSHGEIDPQTKAGYTPLHTASHFGRPAVVRFLLDHGAAVDPRTDLGYTPLHQAAQQGHVTVVRELLEADASPDSLTNAGQTPLSIAENFGATECAEILRPITSVDSLVPSSRAVLPETMHDSVIYDSDDDLLGPRPASADSSRYLSSNVERRFDPSRDITSPTNEDVFDDFCIPRKQRRNLFSFDRAPSERCSAISSTVMHAIEEELRYMADEGDLHSSYATLPQDMEEQRRMSMSPSHVSSARQLQSAAVPSRRNTSGFDGTSRLSELDSSRVSERDSRFFECSSYTGMLSEGSCSNDNMTLDRGPIHSGFLVSFLVDARGGVKRGWRHSGVRIIVPPNRACQPMRVTCKLIRVEKLSYPPPLMEGEALATRVLTMGPPGAQFDGPVVIEIPHYASMRGRERDVTIMRSDDGMTWREHPAAVTDGSVTLPLDRSFDVLETAEELYQRRITRIVTRDFPEYFAIVSTLRSETCVLGPDGAVLNSTVVPSVEAVVPRGALNKRIRLSLQVQQVSDDLTHRIFGEDSSASPIVTLEPRRRKFHRPITITVPLPETAVVRMRAMSSGRSDDEAVPTLRLLCSLTEGSTPARWEDITESTPLLTVQDRFASFSTTVSARFWLIDVSDENIDVTSIAGDLYKEVIAVPFISKFVVFAKRNGPRKGQLRVFCTTDDRLDNTLENHEAYVEVARSRDVEVLQGKPQYLDLTGNLKPISSSSYSTSSPCSSPAPEQLHIIFRAFATNRLSFPVLILDTDLDPTGRILFTRYPSEVEDSLAFCNLSVTLPDCVSKHAGEESNLNIISPDIWTLEHDEIAKALLLDLMADLLASDWLKFADLAGLKDSDILAAQVEHDLERDQASFVLRRIIQQTAGLNDAWSRLEAALRRIGRIDIIRRCLYSTWTDEEWKAIKQYNDQKDEINDGEKSDNVFNGNEHNGLPAILTQNGDPSDDDKHHKKKALTNDSDTDLMAKMLRSNGHSLEIEDQDSVFDSLSPIQHHIPGDIYGSDTRSNRKENEIRSFSEDLTNNDSDRFLDLTNSDLSQGKMTISSPYNNNVSLMIVPEALDRSDSSPDRDDFVFVEVGEKSSGLGDRNGYESISQSENSNQKTTRQVQLSGESIKTNRDGEAPELDANVHDVVHDNGALGLGNVTDSKQYTELEMLNAETVENDKSRLGRKETGKMPHRNVDTEFAAPKELEGFVIVDEEDMVDGSLALLSTENLKTNELDSSAKLDDKSFDRSEQITDQMNTANALGGTMSSFSNDNVGGRQSSVLDNNLKPVSNVETTTDVPNDRIKLNREEDDPNLIQGYENASADKLTLFNVPSKLKDLDNTSVESNIPAVKIAEESSVQYIEEEFGSGKRVMPKMNEDMEEVFRRETDSTNVTNSKIDNNNVSENFETSKLEVDCRDRGNTSTSSGRLSENAVGGEERLSRQKENLFQISSCLNTVIHAVESSDLGAPNENIQELADEQGSRAPLYEENVCGFGRKSAAGQSGNLTLTPTDQSTSNKDKSEDSESSRKAVQSEAYSDELPVAQLDVNMSVGFENSKGLNNSQSDTSNVGDRTVLMPNKLLDGVTDENQDHDENWRVTDDASLKKIAKEITESVVKDVIASVNVIETSESSSLSQVPVDTKPRTALDTTTADITDVAYTQHIQYGVLEQTDSEMSVSPLDMATITDRLVHDFNSVGLDVADVLVHCSRDANISQKLDRDIKPELTGRERHGPTPNTDLAAGDSKPDHEQFSADDLAHRYGRETESENAADYSKPKHEQFSAGDLAHRYGTEKGSENAANDSKPNHEQFSAADLAHRYGTETGSENAADDSKPDHAQFSADDLAHCYGTETGSENAADDSKPDHEQFSADDLAHRYGSETGGEIDFIMSDNVDTFNKDADTIEDVLEYRPNEKRMSISVTNELAEPEFEIDLVVSVPSAQTSDLTLEEKETQVCSDSTLVTELNKVPMASDVSSDFTASVGEYSTDMQVESVDAMTDERFGYSPGDDSNETAPRTTSDDQVELSPMQLREDFVTRTVVDDAKSESRLADVDEDKAARSLRSENDNTASPSLGLSLTPLTDLNVPSASDGNSFINSTKTERLKDALEAVESGDGSVLETFYPLDDNGEWNEARLVSSECFLDERRASYATVNDAPSLAEIQHLQTLLPVEEIEDRTSDVEETQTTTDTSHLVQPRDKRDVDNMEFNEQVTNEEANQRNSSLQSNRDIVSSVQSALDSCEKEFYVHGYEVTLDNDMNSQQTPLSISCKDPPVGMVNLPGASLSQGSSQLDKISVDASTDGKAIEASDASLPDNVDKRTSVSVELNTGTRVNASKAIREPMSYDDYGKKKSIDELGDSMMTDNHATISEIESNLEDGQRILKPVRVDSDSDADTKYSKYAKENTELLSSDRGDQTGKNATDSTGQNIESSSSELLLMRNDTVEVTGSDSYNEICTISDAEASQIERSTSEALLPNSLLDSKASDGNEMSTEEFSSNRNALEAEKNDDAAVHIAPTDVDLVTSEQVELRAVAVRGYATSETAPVSQMDEGNGSPNSDWMVLEKFGIESGSSINIKQIESNISLRETNAAAEDTLNARSLLDKGVVVTEDCMDQEEAERVPTHNRPDTRNKMNANDTAQTTAIETGSQAGVSTEYPTQSVASDIQNSNDAYDKSAFRENYNKDGNECIGTILDELICEEVPTESAARKKRKEKHADSGKNDYHESVLDELTCEDVSTERAAHRRKQGTDKDDDGETNEEWTEEEHHGFIEECFGQRGNKKKAGGGKESRLVVMRKIDSCGDVTESLQPCNNDSEDSDTSSLPRSRYSSGDSLFQTISGDSSAANGQGVGSCHVTVFTDTVEGDPEVTVDVVDHEDLLPDGTLVKRKVTTTQTLRSITKRVVLQGIDDNLSFPVPSPSSTSSSASLPFRIPTVPGSPPLYAQDRKQQFSRYSDRTATEPEISKDVETSESTLRDGSVVKFRKANTRQQQLTSERLVITGSGLFDEEGEETDKTEVFEQLKRLSSPKPEPRYGRSRVDEN